MKTGSHRKTDKSRLAVTRRTFTAGVGAAGLLAASAPFQIGRALASFDIRPAQFSVLVVIEANSGLSQADLAERLGIERARLVRLLDGLEKRGLIRRQPSPLDRRSHALVLTREGQKGLKRMKLLAAEHEANLAKRLGSEKREVLLAVLREFP